MGGGGYKKNLNVCRFNKAFRKKGKIKIFGREDGEDNLRRTQTTIIKSFFFTELNLKFGKIRYRTAPNIVKQESGIRTSLLKNIGGSSI